ncbi:hypothetical protein SSX86_011278 [Deinandra increscens subsp. villosa]|uniref:Uncharacterized protein n=1 Tax=Deinandra increscens subsp. villosa TaxID=3103831 RepID=A0AAP0H499_9ASTR
MADELCSSSTCKFNTSFIPSLFLYDLSFLCSFIVSHPLYVSYFIFFSPYLFRFIFFISPLFLTTSLLILLSLIATTFPPSKLGFIQTMLEQLRSKLNDAHDEIDDEFRDFEDFEIYKIVFHVPPLITVGEGEDKQMTENTVTVTKSETERSLESLFEELDRFEDAIEMKEDETRSHLEDVAELRKLEFAETPISCGDQKSDENSFSVKLNSWRLDSSSSFESCGSMEDATTPFEMKDTETRSYIEEVVGELQNIIQPVKVSFSGDDQKTVQNSYSVKSNSTAEIDQTKVNETRSQVRAMLQKLEPEKKSISGEDQKTVQKTFSVKSRSTAATETKDHETRSHVRAVLQKLEPEKISISGESQKTVQKKSNSTAEIDQTKDIETTRSQVRGVLQKLEPAVISISGEDQTAAQNSFSQKSNSWRQDSSSSFGSYGSMRKEKEWKRTLACKLFEERNNSPGGEEGMDSLWEAYEDDNSSRKSKNRKEAMINQRKKSSGFKYFDDGENDEEEEEDDDEFMKNGQLCCLKALKLSTGKMNLGMGKPNLVKITKALKGFGWLHHVGSKNGKKY